MNGFMFTADCHDCGGQLKQLTHSKPDDLASSCRVICSLCGQQWTICVAMVPYETWNENMARIGASEGMADMGSRA